MHNNSKNILIAPRFTEKGAILSEQGAYVFNVGVDANKTEVIAAVKELYKVTPRKVAMVTIPRQRVMTRGTNRVGKTAGGKKAYVFLKKGDTIELI